MIDKMLVTFISGCLAVILAMQLLLYSLPLFRRLEFDAVCSKYTMLMDRAGGFDNRLANELRRTLDERGFKISSLSGTSSAPYGADLDLHVGASFASCRFRSDLIPEEVIISLDYQSSTVCRVLKSYGAAP